MSRRQLKIGYFVLEGLNSFATVQYLYYFYFFTEKTFGFSTKANLAAAALNGALTAMGSFLGGKFAQKQGYHKALKLGFLIMAVSLAIGSQLSSPAAHVCVMGTMVLGMCLTWPTLEALVSEGEPAGRLEQTLGLYNVIWAGGGALAYFVGGALLQKWARSIFYMPAAIEFLQLALLFWLEARPRKTEGSADSPVRDREPIQRAPVGSKSPLVVTNPRTGLSALRSLWAGRNERPLAAEQKAFVRMAWLANPFAYIAINSLVAIIPSLAAKLGLSTALAGIICSTWCFARMAAFLGLWLWPGWHYRFGWLLTAYLSLIVSFISILLAANIFWLVSAQILFGFALGLIYYSSLFYSMDCSDTKGEHGGIHEAAIGAGNFAGPAVGAIALQFLPGLPHSAAWAVGTCLLVGLGGLLIIRRNGKPE